MASLLATFLLMLGLSGQVTSAPTTNPELDRLIDPNAKIEKLGTGLVFGEGPCWTDADGGYVIFSDQNGGRLHRWDAKNGMTVFRDPSHNTNGNTRDLQGRLLSCEHTTRRVTITELDGTYRTLLDKYDGKRFNSPNDIVVKSDGTIWFTDPTYGLPRGEAKEQEKNYVFRYDPASDKLTPVASDFVMPNGLAFSPDEKRLYIADSGTPRHIRAFDVQGDGTLKGGEVLGRIDRGVPDGIRVDEQGNVWSSAGGGIIIFAPDGHLVGRLSVPETPANLCFGGSDGKTLFIPARSSLYSVRVNVSGAEYVARQKNTPRGNSQ
jgi:gluconolactonase